MKKLLILILAIVSITTAGAQENVSNADSCKAIYNFSTIIVEERQAGTSYESMMEEINIAAGGEDSMMKQYAVGMINMAFNYPAESLYKPTFGNYYFMICIVDLGVDQETYGG